MNTLRALALYALFAVPSALAAPTAEPDWATVERQYRELPVEARQYVGPLFWLHGDETPDQLTGEIDRIAEGGNGSFTAESRPHNDWLGPGWWRDLAISLEAAKKHGLKMWLFDERWWPSGEVAGKVPERYGSKVMQAKATDVTGPRKVVLSDCGPRLIAVIAGKATDAGVDGATLRDLSPLVSGNRLTWDAPKGRWKVMRFTWDYDRGRATRLVDGASRDAVNWYLRTVYQPHYNLFREDFGKAIPGFFYDEPETPGDWGAEVIRTLKARKTDWMKALVAWKFTLAGEEQAAARLAYRNAFGESWGETMYGGIADWCKRHDVVSIGHWLEHNGEYLHPRLCAGDVFQVMKYSDMGSIDLVFDQLLPGRRPPGIYQTTKIASSISHAYAKKDDLAMCEVYGARGQDLSYPEMKWVADWLFAGGVNFLIPHSFNPRAPRDTDCPPYFYNGGYEPRFPLYRVWADYASRLSLMLSGGRHVCPVAIAYPGQAVHEGRAVTPEAITTGLQDALYDADWLPPDVLAERVTISGNELALNAERYRVLVLPAMEVVPFETLALAKRFYDAGGIVIACGSLPTKSGTLGRTAQDVADVRAHIWGAEPRVAMFPSRANAAGGRSYLLEENPTPEQWLSVLSAAGVSGVVETLDMEAVGRLRVLHRVRSGRDVYFLANQDYTGAARTFRLRFRAPGIPEVWDVMRNAMERPADLETTPQGAQFSITLEPCESVLVVMSPEARDLPVRGRYPKGARLAARVEPLNDPQPPPLEPREPWFEGASWIWTDEGDARTSVPNGTRFFRGQMAVPGSVARAVVRVCADNAAVLYVNGKEAGSTGRWEEPLEFDVTSLVREGSNVLAVRATNATDAPSPAGLLVEWRVEPRDGKPLTGSADSAWKWAADGSKGWQEADFDDSGWKPAVVAGRHGDAPWGRVGDRTAGLTLSPVKANPCALTFDLPAESSLAASRVFVEADAIAPEEAAAVTVNGVYAGGFVGRPFRLDVTEYVKPGANRLEIRPWTPSGLRVVVR
jgi:hypothetical protein